MIKLDGLDISLDREKD